MAMLIEAGSGDDGHSVPTPELGLEALSHPVPSCLAELGSNCVYFSGIQFPVHGANADYFGARRIRVTHSSAGICVERSSKERREQQRESFHGRRAKCKQRTQSLLANGLEKGLATPKNQQHTSAEPHGSLEDAALPMTKNVNA